MEEGIDTIRESIADYCGTSKLIKENDYHLINKFLIKSVNVIPKEDFNKLRSLTLQFSVNSNILALRLIYNKYVKGTI